MYEDLYESARNVIDEGGEGWWGADQLGEETDNWIPLVDCEFINQASPIVIIGLLRDLENLKSLNEALQVLVDLSERRCDRMKKIIDTLEQNLSFEKQRNNKEEDKCSCGKRDRYKCANESDSGYGKMCLKEKPE